MRGLIASFITGLVIIAFVVPPQANATDQWIWRDRWDRMGLGFQHGYIIGVDDLSQYLGSMVFQPSGTSSVASALRRAHENSANYDTVKAALEWTTGLVTKESEPFAMVSAVILNGLSTSGQAAGASAGPSGTFKEAGFVWKDRWDPNEWPTQFLDGFVAGVFDLIRSLDNAGKQPFVLSYDVVNAATCNSKIANKNKTKRITIGQVEDVVYKALKNSNGPDENMSLAIFEALRVCKV